MHRWRTTDLDLPSDLSHFSAIASRHTHSVEMRFAGRTGLSLEQVLYLHRRRLRWTNLAAKDLSVPVSVSVSVSHGVSPLSLPSIFQAVQTLLLIWHQLGCQYRERGRERGRRWMGAARWIAMGHRKSKRIRIRNRTKNCRKWMVEATIFISSSL